MDLVCGHLTFAAGTNYFRSAALKIKRVLVPVLILVLMAAAAFWLTGCTSLQMLNGTVSHRGYVRTTDTEKARLGIKVARGKLLDFAENQCGRDPLLEAKRKLVLVYLGMAEHQFFDADTNIFSILAKERALQDEIERARKNN
jgi:hypothetical protein